MLQMDEEQLLASLDPQLDTFRSSLHHTVVPLFDKAALDAAATNKLLTQNQLTKFVNCSSLSALFYDHGSQLTERRRATIIATCLPGAGSHLLSIPWSPPLRLSSRQMRASVSWYMGSEVLSGTTTCPSNCNRLLDPFGDHAVVCALGVGLARPSLDTMLWSVLYLPGVNPIISNLPHAMIKVSSGMVNVLMLLFVLKVESWGLLLT